MATRASATDVIQQIFTRTRPRRSSPRPSPARREAGVARPAGIGRGHEVLAHQDGVVARVPPRRRTSAPVRDPALGHCHHVVGNVGERGAAPSPGTPRGSGGRGCRPPRSARRRRGPTSSSASSCTSTRAIEPGLESRVEEPAQVLLPEGGHDQEDRVGAGDPGLPDLIGVDQEVLAQRGQTGWRPAPGAGRRCARRRSPPR